MVRLFSHARPRSTATLGRLGPVLATLALASGCGGGGGDVQSPTPDAALSPQARIGLQVFFDKSLSGSGTVACSSCHDPAHAHAASDGLAVPLGGVAGDLPGLRNAPSLNYLDRTPAFFFASDGTPTGGFDRDGRADSLSIQAHRPFFREFEMANRDASELVTHLEAAPYADDIRAVFGSGVFDDPDFAVDRVTFALQRYELESANFHPYTSKYDEFLRGRTQLSTQETRGLALYNSATKGNCAACHPSSLQADGSLPLFTDFTYDNLGVPRNPDIPANADPAYFDLGLCGPERTDLAASHQDLCGAFKVPTLRNIAVTAPYFHNGRYATLEEALRFYVRRDTNPEEFYPVEADGTVDKFDDLAFGTLPSGLPFDYRRNVNRTEVPYNRNPGDLPALTDAEIDDVIAFLQTLTDGFVPSSD